MLLDDKGFFLKCASNCCIEHLLYARHNARRLPYVMSQNLEYSFHGKTSVPPTHCLVMWTELQCLDQHWRPSFENNSNATREVLNIQTLRNRTVNGQKNNPGRMKIFSPHLRTGSPVALVHLVSLWMIFFDTSLFDRDFPWLHPWLSVTCQDFLRGLARTQSFWVVVLSFENTWLDYTV